MVSQTIHNFGGIQSKSSQNFMLIKIRYPNNRHGSAFRCFLFIDSWMSLRMLLPALLLSFGSIPSVLCFF